MSYVSKTDWKHDDPITEQDLNRWESGIKSANELKTLIDEAQKWKLTNNTGNVLADGVTNIDTLLASGEYFTAPNCIGAPDGEYYKVTVQTIDSNTTVQVAVRLSGSRNHIRTRVAGVWQPWRKLTDTNLLGSILFGNKFVDTQTANFVGKVSGSTIANPHIGKAGFADAVVPPSGFIFELVDVDYQAISKIDDAFQITTSGAVAGRYSQALFSFNILEYVQRTYGAVPGTTTAEKVVWLRNNITNLVFVWRGYASSASGNKATIKGWNATVNDYFYENSHSNSSSQTIQTDTTIDTKTVLSNDGYASFIAYAEASDGTTPSTINTDYVELRIQLETDIKTNLKMQWMNATLQNSWAAFDVNQTPRYAVDASGAVRLSGAMKSGTLPGTAFTLPAGFRPIKNTYVMANGINGNVYRLSIDTSGGVYVEQSTGSNGNGFVSLDGLTFPTN